MLYIGSPIFQMCWPILMRFASPETADPPPLFAATLVTSEVLTKDLRSLEKVRNYVLFGLENTELHTRPAQGLNIPQS